MRTLLVIIALVSLVGCSTPQGDTSRVGALKVEISEAPLTVKFINTGTKPVQILKPLDGSESCWIMPYYKLIVTDSHDREISRSARCGMMDLWWHTKWPDDYLITIPVGGCYSRPLWPNHDIPTSGTYTLCFHYIFEPDSRWVFGHRYPHHLWRGDACSNTIKMHLEKVKYD